MGYQPQVDGAMREFVEKLKGIEKRLNKTNTNLSKRQWYALAREFVRIKRDMLHPKPPSPIPSIKGIEGPKGIDVFSSSAEVKNLFSEAKNLFSEVENMFAVNKYNKPPVQVHVEPRNPNFENCDFNNSSNSTYIPSNRQSIENFRTDDWFIDQGLCPKCSTHDKLRKDWKGKRICTNTRCDFVLDD